MELFHTFNLPSVASLHPSIAAGAALIKRIMFGEDGCLDQSQSPLFYKLPAEIRERIFEYVLKDYEDSKLPYGEDTCYRRPDSIAYRRTHIALVRTCRKVYKETWHMPFALAEHTFYLAWLHRKPEKHATGKSMQRHLNVLHAFHPDASAGCDHVRIFAQLPNLENGTQLQDILDMKHFHPRSMTITVRHTDHWSWENDAVLSVGAQWVNSCRFPNSLRELRVEFESLERKQDQVDCLASEAVKNWHFRLQGGTVLEATPEDVSTMHWSGSSTWQGRRWTRDEATPHRLDYYVANMIWKPARDQDKLRGIVTCRPCPNIRGVEVNEDGEKDDVTADTEK